MRIRHCRELWYRLQAQLGSCIAVAVAVAGGYSSNWTPSLGISMCLGKQPWKKEKKKKKCDPTHENPMAKGKAQKKKEKKKKKKNLLRTSYYTAIKLRL